MSAHSTSPDSIDALIAMKLPEWLSRSTADQVKALGTALKQQQASAHAVKALMAPIPSLEHYALPLLAAQMRQQLGITTDIRGCRLRTVKWVRYPPPVRSTPVKRYPEASSQPLLATALHNFMAEEEQPKAFNKYSLRWAADSKQDIDYPAYVRLCRQLDLGGKYQALLRKQFALDETASAQRRQEVEAVLEEAHRSRLEVAVRLAEMKREIGASSLRQMLPIISTVPIAPADSQVLFTRQLNLLGKRMQGVVVIEVRHTAAVVTLRGLIVWIPDDPIMPVQEFPSWDALYQRLGMRFHDPAYAKFFGRFIRERDRVAFYTSLNALLSSTNRTSALELDGRNFAVDQPLFAYLRTLQVEKILDDARVLAVPTGDEDASARASRLQGYEDLGLNLLNLAGLFVPVLGEVMLGVAALQIADELYEGYQDWRLGDRQAALDHVFSVAENVAASVALGVGGAATGRLLKRVPFVDELLPIRTDTDGLKLTGSLKAYRVASKSDVIGSSMLHEDQWHFRLHDGSYLLTSVEGDEYLRIKHPLREQAYRPVLEHNGARGWRPALVCPQEWTGSANLLRRLGFSLAELTDEQAHAILECTGFDDAQLRHLHAQNAPAPARILDAVARYRLHERYPQLRGRVFEDQLRLLDTEKQPSDIVLQRDFPGLTLRGAQEVVQQSSSEQVELMLSSQRIPLSITERVRWFLRDSRIDRACAGLRQSQALGSDSEKLMVGLLGELAPWEASLRIELRHAGLDGQLSAQVGSDAASQSLCIVRGETGYQIFNTGGVLLPGSLPTNTLQQALLLSLDDAQKARLGDTQLSAQALGDLLGKAASGERDRVSRLIGQAPIGTGVRPPVRFGDGRIGYPLSGRGETSGQASRRGIRQIYPTLDDSQLQDYMLQLISLHIDPWEHFRQLHGHLDSLRGVLREWQRGTFNVLETLRRQRVANALRRCWRRKIGRRGTGGYALEIRGERVGSLPNLPVGLDFGHVTHLTLRDMALTELADDFLARFPNVRQLDLSDNSLTSVPFGIDQLTALRRLNLGNNRIFMTGADNLRLLALTSLRQLDLSGNLLGTAPDLRQLVHLREVDLRMTGLTQWPERAQQVPWRALMDLRENRIRQLNQENHSLRRAISRISVHDNPLDEVSESYVSEVSSAAGGASPSGQMVSFRHRLVQEAERERWLVGLSGEQRERREAQWLSLVGESGSSNFFRFVRDFALNDDYARHPAYYRARIWQIIEACEQNSEVREQLFVVAGGRRTCEDRLLWVLSEMETRVLIHQQSAGRSLMRSEAELMDVGRSLFRLAEVDRNAARRVETLRASGRDVDEIEVYLAYRYRLATALRLPGQPTTMHYESFSGLTADDIELARSDVLGAESNETLALALADQEYWKEYLHSTYEDRFTALSNRCYTPLQEAEALVQRGEMKEHAYETLCRQQMDDYLAQERELIVQLSREAYQRWPI